MDPEGPIVQINWLNLLFHGPWQWNMVENGLAVWKETTEGRPFYNFHHCKGRLGNQIYRELEDQGMFFVANKGNQLVLAKNI